jgi:hypothetical protein
MACWSGVAVGALCVYKINHSWKSAPLCILDDDNYVDIDGKK